MNPYFFQIISLLFAVLVGSLIAKYAIIWIGGFKPRFIKLILSTLIAYILSIVIAIAFSRFGPFRDVSGGFQMVLGWATLTCTHINLVRSDTGVPLSPGKAMLVALCQVIGVLLILLLIFLPLFLIKRAWRGQH